MRIHSHTGLFFLISNTISFLFSVPSHSRNDDYYNWLTTKMKSSDELQDLQIFVAKKKQQGQEQQQHEASHTTTTSSSSDQYPLSHLTYVTYHMYSHSHRKHTHTRTHFTRMLPPHLSQSTSEKWNRNTHLMSSAHKINSQMGKQFVFPPGDIFTACIHVSLPFSSFS